MRRGCIPDVLTISYGAWGCVASASKGAFMPFDNLDKVEMDGFPSPMASVCFPPILTAIGASGFYV